MLLALLHFFFEIPVFQFFYLEKKEGYAPQIGKCGVHCDGFRTMWKRLDSVI